MICSRTHLSVSAEKYHQISRTQTEGKRMTRLTTAEIRKRRKKKSRLKKKLSCRFCPEGVKKSPRPIYVDYKDLKTLRGLIDRNARILPRRRTGTSAKWHRAVRTAVIRARFIALLPYLPEE